MKAVVVPFDGSLPDVVSSSTAAKAKQYWPTNDRSKWLGILFWACAILDITRVAMSLCMVHIAKELEWDKLETGLVLSSVFWGYFSTQLPAGFLSDIHGGDMVVTWCIFGCAVSTLAIPIVAMTSVSSYLVPSILLVLLLRVCLGFSQGLFFPSVLSLIGKRLPLNERSIGNAVISSGASVGALIIGSLGSVVLELFGWRWVFICSGLFSLLWVVIWKQFFLSNTTRNDDKYRMAKKFEGKEKEVRNPYTPRSTIIPWGKLIRHPGVWAIVVVHFCQNCMSFTLSSWLPTYFHETFPQAKGWIFNVVPYLCLFIGKIFGGQFADKLINSGWSLIIVRKLCETLATGLSGILLLLCMYATEFWQALTCISLVFGLSGMATSGSICNIQDLSPTFAGSISGIVFTITSIPGIIGVYLTGYILHATGSWHMVFQLSAVICIFGNIVYLIFGTTKRIG